MQILPLGYGHYVVTSQIVSINDFNSTPLKRLVNYTEKKLRIVDATFGRKTRSIVVTSSGHIILCAVDSYTLAQRLAKVLNVKLTNIKVEIAASGDQVEGHAP